MLSSLFKEASLAEADHDGWKAHTTHSLPGSLLLRRELADDGVPGVGVRVDAWVWPARAYFIDRCSVLTAWLAAAEVHLTTRGQ